MAGRSPDPSLVPSQIPAALAQRYISASGASGYDGGYGGAPTPGESAGNIFVRLDYDTRRPSNIRVVDARHQLTEISRSEQLRLVACGGNGGNGGIGTNGHDGADGYRGKDATQFSRGTDGGPGGDGGNAGPGTHGAHAGDGGHVSITLGEKDLDLLLAIGWSVNGGTGGAAGKHGIPGVGGRGGRGGSSYSWTEFTTEYYTDSDGNRQSRQVPHYRSNPGGRRGRDGRDGSAPTWTLSAGPNGRNGSARINVEDSAGTAKSYANRYHLVVKSFEVVDENNDGIYEPGEYLIVKNIIVHNQGAMPSPSGNLIKVVIRNSQWLEPETSAPLNMPNSIPPNHKAIIPGQIRALIRHEKSQRKSGQQLLESDTVILLAYSERLQRAVSEFSGGVQVKIQYPVQLTSPAYMNCMTKEDQMEISWIVKNISNRGYGHSSDTQREIMTRLIDSTRSFVLEGELAGRNFSVRDIDNCRSNQEFGISKSFTVADATEVFSTGSMRLELHLSDPHRPEKLREIVNYEVDIQISEGYEYRENSQFLLVVNAHTEGEAILEMKRLIVSGLHLGVDIFNLSLTGTLANDETEKSVLLNYKGKSIIITGDAFRYFGPETTRYNWDLIDPQDVLLLSMNHTGFLFCGVTDAKAQEGLARWASMLSFPVGPAVDTASMLKGHKDQRALVKSLHADYRATGFNVDLKNQYLLSKRYRTLRKIFRRTTDKRLKKTGEALARELDDQMPTRRFMITSEKRSDKVEEPGEKLVNEPIEAPVEDHKGRRSIFGKTQKKHDKGQKGKQAKKKAPSTGIITVAEGLSRTADCVVSHSPIVDDFNIITPHQAMMMVKSLPFYNLALVFWNTVRSIGREGLSAEAAYRNLDGFQRSLDPSRIDDYDEETNLFISYKLCVIIVWAVEHVLSSDAQHLTTKYNPQYKSRHGIANKGNADAQAQRVAQFFAALPDDSISASDEGVEIAVEALASLNAALKSPNIIIQAWQSLPGLHTKPQRDFAKHKKGALLFMAPPEKIKELQKRVVKRTKGLREEFKKNRTPPSEQMSRIQKELSAVSKGYHFGYTDLSAAKSGSEYRDPSTFRKCKAQYRELLHRQRDDAAYAREMRKAILTQVYTSINYIPLADFN